MSKYHVVIDIEIEQRRTIDVRVLEVVVPRYWPEIPPADYSYS